MKFVFTIKVKTWDAKPKKRSVIPSKLKDLRVLVVDDNNYAREVLKTYLEQFSYKPTLVASGKKAIGKIKENTYDVVLMDWKMPGLNGIETWKQMKKILAGKEYPKIIFVTAYDKEEVARLAKTAGIDGIIVKPVFRSTLHDAIMKAFSEEVSVQDELVPGEDYPAGFEKITGSKILLVEDNEVNQQMEKEMLEVEGFWVDIAENGEVAIKKVLNNRYDIVLMDLQMPVLDGYETARKLREEHQIKGLPIIALSADVMSGTVEQVLKAGMDGYISKPIERQELFAALVKWIKSGQRERNVVSKDADEMFFDGQDGRGFGKHRCPGRVETGLRQHRSIPEDFEEIQQKTIKISANNCFNPSTRRKSKKAACLPIH